MRPPIGPGVLQTLPIRHIRRGKSARVLRSDDARRKNAWQANNRHSWKKGGMMKKYFLATASVLALSAPGHASDLPAKVKPYAPVAAPIWTGPYLGIVGGVARHDALFKDFGCAFDCGTFDGNKTGGAAGGLIGYNWQSGNFVYGLESDWIWAGVKTATNNGTFDFRAESSFDAKWIATVRGRAGLAVDRRSYTSLVASYSAACTAILE